MAEATTLDKAIEVAITAKQALVKETLSKRKDNISTAKYALIRSNADSIDKGLEGGLSLSGMATILQKQWIGDNSLPKTYTSQSKDSAKLGKTYNTVVSSSDISETLHTLGKRHIISKSTGKKRVWNKVKFDDITHISRTRVSKA